MTLNLIQGTDEWRAARLGRVTASRIADVVARTKTGWGASRATYAAQIIAERLTGQAAESFTNGAMQWGTDHEADARDAYAFYRDADVLEVGFVPHPKLAAGASPDGLVGDTGLVEIKCPNTATHIETLRGRSVPLKYVLQMQWQMACTGRQWCDFASYDPRMPETMRLFVARETRDEATVEMLNREAAAFLAEIEATVAELRAIYEPERAAA